MVQDLRHAVRILLKNKVFSLVAVLSLALGIGANTAIFSLLDAVLLKALPVREPGKLVLFGDGDEWPALGDLPHRSWELFSYPFYRQVRQRNDVFSDMAAINSIPWVVHGAVNLSGPTEEMVRIRVSLSEHIGRSLVQQRLVARLAAFFGLLALALASIGLYGILSYAVARRTNEIGIRMALGAQRANVFWLVLREALALVIAGVLIGLLASLAVTRTVSTMLYGLEPTDPLTIIAALSVLLAIATLAGYLPARRAARVDPMVALRDE